MDIPTTKNIRTTIFAISALVMLVLFLFHPAIVGGKILAPLDITTNMLPPWNEHAQGVKAHNHKPSDAVTQYIPYRLFAEKSLREDGYIGWNPYEMGGYNLAANTMALPASWTMQLHRWLDFHNAWNIGIIAEFLIAGVGMILFLRARGLFLLPCLVGAVAFMLNAQFTVWIYHRWALGSFCWIPWIIWAFGEGFRSEKISKKQILLPAFIALALLGGTLQHAIYIFLTTACLAAAQTQFRKPLSNGRILCSWALTWLVASGFVLFTIVPQINAYLHNLSIGHTRGGLGYEQGFIQPFVHLLLIPARIWPWLFGDPQSIDGWKMLKSSFMSLNFIGTIPMLLGFAGLFVRSMPAAAKWLIIVGLAIPLTPLVGPLYHRVELLFIIGAAWMCAEMLQHLGRRIHNASTQSECPSQPISKSFLDHLTHIWRRMLILSVGMIGILLLIGTLLPHGIRDRMENKVIALSEQRGKSTSFGQDQAWLTSRALEWTARFSLTHPRTAWVYGLLVIGSVGLLLASGKLSQRKLGQSLILVSTTLELNTLFQTWITWSDPADLRPKSELIDKVRELAGENRVLQSSPDTKFAEIFATPNLLAANFITSMDAYESIQYKSFKHLSNLLHHSDVHSLAGVGVALHPSSNPPQIGTENWPASDLGYGFVIRRNPSLPPPFSSGSSALPSSLADVLPSLAGATALQASNRTMNGFILIVPPNSNWIRLSQNWHSGWKWRAVGHPKWQEFQNGFDSACWIENIPENATKIEIRFIPRHIALTGISMVTFTVWLCFFFSRFMRIVAPIAIT